MITPPPSLQPTSRYKSAHRKRKEMHLQMYEAAVRGKSHAPVVPSRQEPASVGRLGAVGVKVEGEALVANQDLQAPIEVHIAAGNGRILVAASERHRRAVLINGRDLYVEENGAVREPGQGDERVEGGVRGVVVGGREDAIVLVKACVPGVRAGRVVEKDCGGEVERQPSDVVEASCAIVVNVVGDAVLRGEATRGRRRGALWVSRHCSETRCNVPDNTVRIHDEFLELYLHKRYVGA